MFRRPTPGEVEEPLVFTKVERIGSAIAHAAPLLLGVPLFPLLGNIGFALLPSPILAYIISRSFRSRQSTWGAFQGMQATLVHLMLVVLVFRGLLHRRHRRCSRRSSFPDNADRICDRVSPVSIHPLGRLGYGLGIRLPLHFYQQFRGQDYRRQPAPA